MAASTRRKKKKQEFEQFSKKLSRWVLVFWAVYRILALVAVVIRPDIASGLTALTVGVDDAAMCVVISYTVNSATEKVAVQYFTAKTEERKAMYTGVNEEEEEDIQG